MNFLHGSSSNLIVVVLLLVVLVRTTVHGYYSSSSTMWLRQNSLLGRLGLSFRSIARHQCLASRRLQASTSLCTNTNESNDNNVVNKKVAALILRDISVESVEDSLELMRMEMQRDTIPTDVIQRLGNLSYPQIFISERAYNNNHNNKQLFIEGNCTTVKDGNDMATLLQTLQETCGLDLLTAANENGQEDAQKTWLKRVQKQHKKQLIHEENMRQKEAYLRRLAGVPNELSESHIEKTTEVAEEEEEPIKASSSIVRYIGEVHLRNQQSLVVVYIVLLQSSVLIDSLSTTAGEWVDLHELYEDLSSKKTKFAPEELQLWNTLIHTAMNCE